MAAFVTRPAEQRDADGVAEAWLRTRHAAVARIPPPVHSDEGVRDWVSSRLQLWTFVSNEPARRFYAQRGFVCVEQTDGSGNEERAPDMRLVWRDPPGCLSEPGGPPGAPRQAVALRVERGQNATAMATPNRSAPPHAVVPIVTYEDVASAVAWLTLTFGFVEKIRIGDHRAQLDTGGGAVIVADATHGRRAPAGSDGVTHSTMVRVHDIDAHFRTALAGGAEIAGEPADLPFGERQYSARDLAGHLWTFSQSVADVAPEDWGGVSVSPW